MFEDEFKEFYIEGQKYSKSGKVYILNKIVFSHKCNCECPGPLGNCDGKLLLFTPAGWECPYDGDELAYEKVQDTNTRW